MPLSTPGPSISLLLSVIFPEVGLINPAVMFNKVVLPQPDGPRTVKSSPFLSLKFTSYNA